VGKPIIAVIKADAYGLGAEAVVKALGDLVEAFYVFDAAEAVAAQTQSQTGKRCIALNGSWTNPGDYRSANVCPVVWSVDRARQLRQTGPVLSIDTGQQRFSATIAEASAVQKAGDCSEIMTHAVNRDQVETFRDCTDMLDVPGATLHAAGTALLGQPRAWFDAVRPGLALYRGAVTVRTRIVEVRDSNSPAGYTGFMLPRFGVILIGYLNGMQKGTCRVNGVWRQIVEVGMQSAFVELGPADRVGDWAVLLGSCEGSPAVTEGDIARAWGRSEQEVLVRLCGGGVRDVIDS
jgi:alanine racemase